MEEININIDLLENVLDSLIDMTNYADDGVVSRYDPEFKEFYEKVDKARELITKLNDELNIKILGGK